MQITLTKAQRKAVIAEWQAEQQRKAIIRELKRQTRKAANEAKCLAALPAKIDAQLKRQHERREDQAYLQANQHNPSRAWCMALT